MKVGILTTVNVQNATTLGALRVMIDSVRALVPRDEYDVLLVADDCSSDAPEIQAYYRWLEESGTATVHRMGPPRLPHWAFKHGAPPEAPRAHGHAVGLMLGFWKLRERGCTHAWVIDGDCAVLRPGALREAREVLAVSGAVVVTDYFGGAPDPRIQVVDAERRMLLAPDGSLLSAESKARHPCHAAWVLYGFPVLFCALVDLEEYHFGGLWNAGWVNSRWGYRLFQSGAKVAYYPFFQGRSVFHLGFGFSTNMADAAEFGNSTSCGAYGGKNRGARHAGFLQLARDFATHSRWLRDAATTPFDALVRMPPEWLVDPPLLPCDTRDDTDLRPLHIDDLPALREIDSDPEATRFLQWGPHGEEHTRAFLERAARTRWQFFVLTDRAGAFLGYGEVRPLPERGPHAAGLTYIIPRRLWGKGYGTRLLHLLFEAGYSQLGYFPLYIAIDTEHTASRGVLDRVTYRGDWVYEGQEDYLLKGAPRRRDVFRRDLPITPGWPSEDPVEALRERERTLFDEYGVAR